MWKGLRDGLIFSCVTFSRQEKYVLILDFDAYVPNATMADDPVNSLYLPCREQAHCVRELAANSTCEKTVVAHSKRSTSTQPFAPPMYTALLHIINNLPSLPRRSSVTVISVVPYRGTSINLQYANNQRSPLQYPMTPHDITYLCTSQRTSLATLPYLIPGNIFMFY